MSPDQGTRRAHHGIVHIASGGRALTVLYLHRLTDSYARETSMARCRDDSTAIESVPRGLLSVLEAPVRPKWLCAPRGPTAPLFLRKRGRKDGRWRRHAAIG